MIIVGSLLTGLISVFLRGRKTGGVGNESSEQITKSEKNLSSVTDVGGFLSRKAPDVTKSTSKLLVLITSSR